MVNFLEFSQAKSVSSSMHDISVQPIWTSNRKVLNMYNLEVICIYSVTVDQQIKGGTSYRNETQVMYTILTISVK